MKPTVKYIVSHTNYIKVGSPAFIQPVDHPDTVNVSNKRVVMTSPVIEWDINGNFETRNTIYVPA